LLLIANLTEQLKYLHTACAVCFADKDDRSVGIIVHVHIALKVSRRRNCYFKDCGDHDFFNRLETKTS